MKPMTQLKYQNYKHYKLPITMNPLEYGKLIYQNDNEYIILITKHTIVVIVQLDKFNEVKLFKDGDLVFTYKDHKTDENTFVRSLDTRKFTFSNNKLVNINTDKIINRGNRLINSINNLGIRRFSTIPKNIIKLRKTRTSNIWNVQYYSINNKVFTKDLFNSKFNIFWDNISHQFIDNNHMFILFKIKYKDSDYTTIGSLQRLNKGDKNWYLNWILNNMEFKSEYYNEIPITDFVFSYGFKDGIAPIKEKFKTDLNFQNYKNNKLVISFNPLDFGILISENKFENYTQFILQTNDNLLVKINKFDDYNQVEYISGGNTILEFKDEFISENKFVRILDNKKFYFENNKEILFLKEMKTKFISKLKPLKNFKNKFICFDIETYIKDSVLTVFCISIYDGENKNSFFLSDFKNSEELIISALKSIMIRKYNGYNIYIHNMAKFDIIFIMKYLVKLGSVNPVIHNGRIITINLNYGKDNKYQLQFRDSYLLLLNSLMKLCKSFKVETYKSVFPYLFVNENNLDYIGSVPEFKYFDNKISPIEYNKYKSNYNTWNLKNEAIKYCETDVISLYQVIFKFAELIFDLFGRNVHHYPTLPSLAFGIFRSKFMIENTIPQLSGRIANDIRTSYTGGSCDMYIPSNNLLEWEGIYLKIYCYDVNSLYPFVMRNCDMPVGTPTYFNGDIRAIDPNAFGFFYCKITAPDNLRHPIIQTHVKTNNGIRTIAPLGTWEDMLFSGEMDNAIKYGYKFEILWGYTFERKNIFKDYVDFLYNFRLKYPKDDPLNLIAKLLLNSLYGRFGMIDNFNEFNVIHKDYFADFENKFLDNILGTVKLGDYILVEFKNQIEEEDDSTHNVSIGIASAITAYARIHMSQFKNNPDFKLYYSDTDSAYTDKPLPEDMVSSTILGKMKLENVLTKAIFLAPKVYCLQTDEGKVIHKVKGLSHDIQLNMKDFNDLLYKESFLQKFQDKWNKNLSSGYISVKNELYTLKVTDNKRKLIYDRNNKLIGTVPFVINKDKEIINK